MHFKVFRYDPEKDAQSGGKADDAAKLVVSLAEKPASQDSLKWALLNSLASSSSSVL